MQFNPVYLYTNKLDVFTSLSDTWPTERYRKVYNRNLKVFRGVDNRIDIQVRNSDQKASNITGSVLVFNLISKDTKDLVLQKDFSPMDLNTGKVTIKITEAELLDLDNGLYEYSIVKEVREVIDSSNHKVINKLPLYVDSQYDARAVLEISGDVYGDVSASRVIDTFHYTSPKTQGINQPSWYESEIVDAHPISQSAYPMHTFQFYSTNYTGSVLIQGSLDSQGATPRQQSWTTISTVDLETESYKNISGKWNWFRIRHTPTKSSNTAEFTVGQTLLLNYQVSIYLPGSGYQNGDTVLIKGGSLGGSDTTNDLTITVTSVNGIGGITGITWAGTSHNGVQTFVLSGTTNGIGTIDKVLYR